MATRQASSFVRGVLLASVVLLSSAAADAQSRYSGIVVFGTSLSDPGNAFALRGAQGTPPDFTLNPLLIPGSPYARGGHHFSDGATWIEQYGRSVGLGGSVKAALASHGIATNFAVGSARSYEDGINFNLGRQVDTFLTRTGGAAPSTALYVIEMGGNDVRDAFTAYATGGNGDPILAQALGSISANIQRLYGAGARDFLVWSVPDIGITPAIRSLGPAAGGLATQVTQGFNGGLSAVIAQLDAALPGAMFTRLDAFALLNEISGAPLAFGLVNVSSACVTTVAPFHCDRPSEFLFWDGIHPSKAGHAILAGKAAEVVR